MLKYLLAESYFVLIHIILESNIYVWRFFPDEGEQDEGKAERKIGLCEKSYGLPF